MSTPFFMLTKFAGICYNIPVRGSLRRLAINPKGEVAMSKYETLVVILMFASTLAAFLNIKK